MFNETKFPFIPPGYRKIDCTGFTLFTGKEEPAATLGVLRDSTTEALNSLEILLDYSHQRKLAVCCYDSNKTARTFLQRVIDSTFAGAPFCDDVKALIIVQSPGADARNGDQTRMKRVIAHEITHHLAAEITGSRKTLGDGNVNKYIPAWLDEGLAEVVCKTVCGLNADLSEAAIHFQQCTHPMTFSQMNLHLDDLVSDLRQIAFSYSTAAVYTLVRKRGIRDVFRNLREIASQFDDTTLCSPSLLIFQ